LDEKVLFGFFSTQRRNNFDAINPCLSLPSSLHSLIKEETLETQLHKIKRILRRVFFRLPKRTRRLFGQHLRWTGAQVFLAIIASGLMRANQDVKQASLLLLLLCGLLIGPFEIHKRLPQYVKASSVLSFWGGWLFQSSVCATLLLFLLPIPNRWFFLSIAAVIGAIFLLTYSTKRSSPFAAE
jgi:hypothetical protein